MPSYFVRCTAKGIVVSNVHKPHDLDKWSGPDLIEIDIEGVSYPVGLDLGGKTPSELHAWLYKQEVKYGFFACDNPKELGLTFGDEMPFTITDKPCNTYKFSFWSEEVNICWATPD
jgi:hypothetical protein